VLFVGSGSTGAIHKLIGILDFNEPPVNKYKFHLFCLSPELERKIST